MDYYRMMAQFTKGQREREKNLPAFHHWQGENYPTLFYYLCYAGLRLLTG